MKAWKQYPNVRAAWTHNSEQWKSDPLGSAKNIVAQLRAKKSLKYFRIHVAGDFMNQTHLDMWSYIAGRLPSVKFRAFTKRFDLNYGFCPQNLIIGFSIWPGCKDMPPKMYDDTHFKAWVQDGTEKRIPKNARECKDDCSVCKYCWEQDAKDDIYFKLH
jgi:hypothetical protein